MNLEKATLKLKEKLIEKGVSKGIANQEAKNFHATWKPWKPWFTPGYVDWTVEKFLKGEK